MSAQEDHPLNEIFEFLGKFVSYPSQHAQIAHTLWIAHTHAMDLWDSTPRIAFLSKEPGSGKSRALEVTELLVPNPVEAVNVTPAYMFRKVGSEDGRPTILYDEIDTVFGPKAKDNEEIRGLLNAGHRKHSKAGRCSMRGKQVVTEEIPAYCAVALAGLGGLPDTILTRSIIIKMRRRTANELISPFRRRVYESEGNLLRERLNQWMSGIEELRSELIWPEMPAGIVDRDADVWEALIQIADQAGIYWANQAREAALSLVTESKQFTPSLGVQLLADIRTLFENRELISTEEALKQLLNMAESPWNSFKGKPIDARRLANQLKDYGIHSKSVRIGESILKGYYRADFHDAWIRYTPNTPAQSATSATSATPGITNPFDSNVADVTYVTDLPEDKSIPEDYL
jgi:hypothetical protein